MEPDAMAIVEGPHARGDGEVVRYRVEYEVVGEAIHFRASFANGGAAHEGQFDFDRSRLDAAAAVDAFMQNHIEKSDWDAAP
jgi:hypothetical protein